LSAVDCVQPAIQHAREQLFSRFRSGQWWRLALVGILAGELHLGGCNFGNLRPFMPRRPGTQEFLASPFPHIDPARIAQFAGLIAAVALLAIVLFFVFLYINSIFRFILFDSVLRRECSIADGWQRWHRAGRRYFLWQLVFAISTGIFFGLLIGIPLMLVGGAGWLKDSSRHLAGMAGGLILLFGVVLISALVVAVVQALAKDFLVPLMALEDLDFADGWSRLLAMLHAEPGKYAVYILLKIALAIAAAILFGILAFIPALVVIVPCAIVVFGAIAAGVGWTVTTVSLAVIFGVMAFLLLIYLVAFVCVPATVFFPAYALYFFAGRYPILAAQLNPAPPAPQPPPVPEALPPGLPPSPEPIG
jgi:hypothetical protein